MKGKQEFIQEIEKILKNLGYNNPKEYFSNEAYLYWQILCSPQEDCGIYKITNLINNKVYIGQSIQLKERWQQHLTSKKKYIIYEAFKKYGIENFSFEVIEYCSPDNLNEREKYWISYYHSFIGDPECHGYNMTLGGDSCGHELLQKKVKQYDLNGNFIKEYNSLKEAAEQNNLDDSNIGACCHQKEHFHTIGGYQWKFSDDDREITKYIDKQSKPVLQYDLQDNFIKEFESVRKAAQAVNRSSTNISSACKRKGTSGGYKWRYKGE